MNKQLKKLFVLILTLVLTSIVFFEASVTSSLAADGGTTVYITKTGKCYHTGTCRYASKSGTETTLEKAVECGLKPCSVCNPPSLTDLDKADTMALTKSSSEASSASATTSFEYVLNTNSKKFHYSNCASAKKIKSSNRATSSLSRDELIDEGYSPCGNCNP